MKIQKVLNQLEIKLQIQPDSLCFVINRFGYTRILLSTAICGNPSAVSYNGRYLNFVSFGAFDQWARREFSTETSAQFIKF